MDGEGYSISIRAGAANTAYFEEMVWLKEVLKKKS